MCDFLLAYRFLKVKGIFPHIKNHYIHQKLALTIRLIKMCQGTKWMFRAHSRFLGSTKFSKTVSPPSHKNTVCYQSKGYDLTCDSWDTEFKYLPLSSMSGVFLLAIVFYICIVQYFTLYWNIKNTLILCDIYYVFYTFHAIFLIYKFNFR